MKIRNHGGAEENQSNRGSPRMNADLILKLVFLQKESAFIRENPRLKTSVGAVTKGMLKAKD